MKKGACRCRSCKKSTVGRKKTRNSSRILKFLRMEDGLEGDLEVKDEEDGGDLGC